MTRPFSRSASPIASRLSALALIEKPAGVDDHRIGALVIGRDRIALGPQAGQDAFAVDQRLGAAERDHADGGLARAAVLGDPGAGKVGAEEGRVLGHWRDIQDRRGGAEGGAGRAGRRDAATDASIRAKCCLSDRRGRAPGGRGASGASCRRCPGRVGLTRSGAGAQPGGMGHRRRSADRGGGARPVPLLPGEGRPRLGPVGPAGGEMRCAG